MMFVTLLKLKEYQIAGCRVSNNLLHFDSQIIRFSGVISLSIPSKINELFSLCNIIV
jgi:hypothetical protein